MVFLRVISFLFVCSQFLIGFILTKIGVYQLKMHIYLMAQMDEDVDELRRGLGGYEGGPGGDVAGKAGGTESESRGSGSFVQEK